MSADRYRVLVAAAPVGRLATTGPGGRIDVVPFVFALAGDRLVSAVDHKPKRTTRLQRLANIERTPDVTVLVDHYEDDWARLWWVRIRGRARIVEDVPEHEAAVAALVAKYPQYRDRRPEGPAIVIEPQQWRGWAAD